MQWAIVNGVTGSFYIKGTRPFSVDKGEISKMSNLKKKKSFKMSLKNQYIYNWFKFRKKMNFKGNTDYYLSVSLHWA